MWLLELNKTFYHIEGIQSAIVSNYMTMVFRQGILLLLHQI